MSAPWSSEEVESFAQIVVRDLRSPLAAILGFSQALSEGSAGELTAQGTHYLRRIRSAAEQMDRTTDAISRFCTLAHASVNRSLVDLAPIVHDCIAGLRLAEPGREVGASIAPCMWAEADPRLLKLALAVLLGNAWKYSSHQAEPAVGVGMELDPDNEMCYFVRDNGTGFGLPGVPAMPHSVQRLHGEAFAAMGIGLATVKRIIDKHGGAIRATWKRGAGTTIYFTLPAAQKDA